MPAQPVHIQDREPGTTKRYAQSIGELVDGDGYHYVEAEPAHENNKGMGSNGAYRALTVMNSITGTGRMYEEVKDESILALKANPETKLLRCSKADYEAQQKRWRDDASNRIYVKPESEIDDQNLDNPTIGRGVTNRIQKLGALSPEQFGSKFTLKPDAEGVGRDELGYGPEAGREGWKPDPVDES